MSELKLPTFFFVLRYFNLLISLCKSWLILGSIGAFSDLYSELIYFNRFAPFLLLGTEIASFRNLSRSNSIWNRFEVTQILFIGFAVFLIALLFVPHWALFYIISSALIRLLFNRLRLMKKQTIVAMVEILVNAFYLIVIIFQSIFLLKFVVALNFLALLIWIYFNSERLRLDITFLKQTFSLALEGIILIAASSFSTLLFIFILHLLSFHLEKTLWNQYNFGLSIANGLMLAFGSLIWYYQKELFNMPRSYLLRLTIQVLIVVLLLTSIIDIGILWINPIFPEKDLSFVSYWIYIMALLISSSVYQSYLIANRNYRSVLGVMIFALCPLMLSYFGYLSIQFSGYLACLMYLFGLGIIEFIHNKYQTTDVF